MPRTPPRRPSTTRTCRTREWVLQAKSLIEFPPVISGGALFFGTNHGRVFAVSGTSGRTLWTRDFGRCIAASPAAVGRTVYVSVMDPYPCSADHDPADGFVVALDSTTGKERWRSRVGVTESSPLVVGRTLYVGSWDTRLYALGLRTGAFAGRSGPARRSRVLLRRTAARCSSARMTAVCTRSTRRPAGNSGHGRGAVPSMRIQRSSAIAPLVEWSLGGTISALGIEDGRLLWVDSDRWRAPTRPPLSGAAASTSARTTDISMRSGCPTASPLVVRRRQPDFRQSNGDRRDRLLRALQRLRRRPDAPRPAGCVRARRRERTGALGRNAMANTHRSSATAGMRTWSGTAGCMRSPRFASRLAALEEDERDLATRLRAVVPVAGRAREDQRPEARFLVRVRRGGRASAGARGRPGSRPPVRPRGSDTRRDASARRPSSRPRPARRRPRRS